MEDDEQVVNVLYLNDKQKEFFDRIKILAGLTSDVQVVGMLVAFYIANYNDQDCIDRANHVLNQASTWQ